MPATRTGGLPPVGLFGHVTPVTSRLGPNMGPPGSKALGRVRLGTYPALRKSILRSASTRNSTDTRINTAVWHVRKETNGDQQMFQSRFVALQCFALLRFSFWFLESTRTAPSLLTEPVRSIFVVLTDRMCPRSAAEFPILADGLGLRLRRDRAAQASEKSRCLRSVHSLFVYQSG